MQQLLFKVCETVFFFRQSKIVYSILWSVWVSFAFLEKARPNRYCLRKETKAVIRRCSVKKVFLEISQNSQENTCASCRPATLLKKESLALVFSCKFCEISQNNFLYRTPLVTAAEENCFTHVVI